MDVVNTLIPVIPATQQERSTGFPQVLWVFEGSVFRITVRLKVLSIK